MSEFGPTLKEQVSDHNAVLVCELKARVRLLEADNKKLATASEDYMVKFMRARNLLDECERAVKAIIDDQTTGGGDDTFPIAKTLLTKLRKEQADE